MDEYDWDVEKAKSNLRKHGVSFASASFVLEDELAVTVQDESHHEEQRWVTVGRDDRGRVVVVVYCHRGTGIRIISAREATPRERRRYEEL